MKLWRSEENQYHTHLRFPLVSNDHSCSECWAAPQMEGAIIVPDCIASRLYFMDAMPSMRRCRVLAEGTVDGEANGYICAVLLSI